MNLIGLFTKIERVQIVSTSDWPIRHVHNEEEIDDFDAVGESFEFLFDLANFTDDMFDLLALIALVQIEVS